MVMLSRDQLIELLKDPEVRGLLRDALGSSPPPTLYLTPSEFGDRHGVSLRTVMRWLKDGLPSYLKGKVRRIPVADGDPWVARASTSGKKPTRRYSRRSA